MGHLPGRCDPPAWGGAWKGLLLAASVLGSCLQPAPAQSTRPPGTIVLSPPSPVVGGGVRLVPPSPPQNTATCAWFRSETEVGSKRILTYYLQAAPAEDKGPMHTGRETGGPGCALDIRELRLNDTGNYSVLMDAPGNRHLTAVFLRISDSSPESPSGLSPGAIAGIVIGSLAGAALVGGLLYLLLCRNGRGPEQHVPVGGQAAPPPSQGVGDKKPTMADPDVQYSTLTFGSGAQKPAPGPQPQRENGTVYSEIKKK